MRVIIIDDAVEINGRKYVPDDGICRLGMEHFEAAEDWPDGGKCLKWAFETQSSVQEMCAWHRAMTDVEPKAEKPTSKKVALLPVPGKASGKLF